MIRAIFWKEWHEHRFRYITYWLTLNVPIFLFCMVIAFTKWARAPFADLSNALVWKYLPTLSLLESLLLDSVFMVAAGYLAVATFSHEVEDRSLFFLFEQGVPRGWYIAIKFLNGAMHVVAATCVAALLAPAAVYGIMLLSGKVTVAGSGAAFAAVMGAAARATLWCSLMALMAFAASALISSTAPRFWLAAVSSVTLVVLFLIFSSDFFYMPAPDGEPISATASSASPWITISRALTPSEVHDFAQWQALPLSVAALITAIFCVATALVYQRKELK
jgi:ABC-type transport system involved in multi-copper enzyme maturation permease subunit